ncbi:VC0807 family protein [Inconstantimicrobium mannanitabidum]|uniref:Uncharacterized protein n=1 Tax=Inconstantimicrobium mannanitabidum TaxID=1604901 RepID=A0ACB5RHI5_9CLOT|nr:VC0807 family protein [Clostridium sp. TW13]GKX68524.1 hypothetical protein rsdtw13_37820 [Clostridium sp. TW13]
MENISNKKQSLLKSVFNRDFVISAIIPIIIFATMDHIGMTLNGIILSGLWSIGVVIINFIKNHEFNALATISAVFYGVGLIGTVISKNPNFYLISPIIKDILYALIFFGSLLFKRSLIQVIVEQSFYKTTSKELKSQAKYIHIWRMLSIAWGILNLSQAGLRILLLHSISMSQYYAISTMYDNISTPLMIAFSIMVPQWYFKKQKLAA